MGTAFRSGLMVQNMKVPHLLYFQGNWIENKACGYGIFYHVDGDKYSGEWKDDRANGYGVYE